MCPLLGGSTVLYPDGCLVAIDTDHFVGGFLHDFSPSLLRLSPSTSRWPLPTPLWKVNSCKVNGKNIVVIFTTFFHTIRKNLSIMDTLGTDIFPFIKRLSSLRRLKCTSIIEKRPVIERFSSLWRLKCVSIIEKGPQSVSFTEKLSSLRRFNREGTSPKLLAISSSSGLGCMDLILLIFPNTTGVEDASAVSRLITGYLASDIQSLALLQLRERERKGRESICIHIVKGYSSK